MGVSDEINSEVDKILKEGRAKVECKEIEGQPGTYICKGQVINKDGKTFQTGSAIVRFESKDNGKLVLAMIPAEGNTLTHYVIKKHLQKIYSDAEFITEGGSLEE